MEITESSRILSCNKTVLICVGTQHPNMHKNKHSPKTFCTN